MASAPWCSQEIYDAAGAFRDRCLRRDGSLFTDRRVWTIEGLQAIDARLARGDLESGNWLDKLEAQLDDLAADELLLAAELVFMLLLPQSDMLGSRKREQLDRVLSLVPEAPAVPEPLDAAFDGGGVASFTTAKGWSLALLRFIIRLAVNLRERPDAEREAVLADPWAFRAVVAEVRTSTDQMMANAIKHALFPETFESIISPAQRESLITTFGALPGVADQPDSDRKIGRIVELGSAATDGGFNLNEDVFRRVWSQPADPHWIEGVRLAQRLYAREDFDKHEREYKLILHERIGAVRTALLAGDGSWPQQLATALKHRRQNLVGWRVRDAFLEWVDADTARAAAALRLLWTPGEPAIREFGYSLPAEPPLSGRGTRASLASLLLMGVDVRHFPYYKPTVHEGLRRALGLQRVPSLPEVDPEATYRPTDLGVEADPTTVEALYADWVGLLQEFRYRLLAAGTQLRDLLDAQGLAWWLISAHPPEGWTGDDLAALEAFGRGATPPSKPQIQPGVAGLLPTIDAELAAKLHLPANWLGGLLDMLEAKKQLILYGPPGTGKTFVAQRLGKHIAAHGGDYRLVQFHPSYTYEDFFEGYRPQLQANGTLGFELVPGALRQIAAAAAANPSAPYLLIIDEINRGNIAKIFGELYFLLEYRDEGIRLQYARSDDEPFALPQNLFLLGTMNTADRSIALVDTALRRRFFFEELSPTKPPVDTVLEQWLAANDHDPDAAMLLRALNVAIDDEDFSIGPSYFITRDGALPDLDRIWANAIMPLLRERYYGTSEDLARFGLAALRRGLEADED